MKKLILLFLILSISSASAHMWHELFKPPSGGIISVAYIEKDYYENIKFTAFVVTSELELYKVGLNSKFEKIEFKDTTIVINSVRCDYSNRVFVGTNSHGVLMSDAYANS